MGKFSKKYGTAWSREETILALYLYCQLPFAKTKRTTPEVIELANVIGRTPSAVARKLGNFGPFDQNLAKQGINLFEYLFRHITGDWGDLGEEDKKENDFSVKNSFRILSSYNTREGKLWIITEADRSVTTFLLPEEY